MTSVFASRRRAEEFHSLVESPVSGAPRDAHLEEFLAIVESLRAVPDAEPRPEFVTSLRDELMAQADTLLVPAKDDRLTLPARNPRRDRRIAVAIGGIALVGAGTSMAVAAQSALPGEMLYPLKRAIEDAETGVATSPDTKGRTLLDSATTRLSEVDALGREGDLADEGTSVSSNLVDFGSHANQAAAIILDEYAETGDRDLIRDLRDFTGDSMATLESLEDQVPASARDELLAAVEVVSEIDARARQACPSCGGAGVDQIPPVLLSSETSDAPVVVIPGATVDAWQPDGRGSDARGSDGGGGRGAGEESLTGSLLGSDDGAGGGSAGSGGGAANPLDDLTDGLTGDGPTASNGGAGGVDDTVKDTAKGLKDTVKGTVKGTKKSLDDTAQQLEDTVDELGDSLLGGG